MMIGGTPTAKDMIIPIFVPSESESRPRASMISPEEDPEPELVLDESSPPFVVSGRDEDAAVAIGPTLMVVKELGCSEVSLLQHNIMAAIAPANAALHSP